MNQEKLQYEPLIYVLALFGLPLCCCMGAGILPAGIAYFIANNELKKCYEREEPYVNQNGVYTGKIIALVIVVINILYLAYTIYQIQTIGWDELMRQSQELMEQYEQQQ